MTLNEQYLNTSSDNLSNAHFDSLALFEQYEPVEEAEFDSVSRDDSCDNLYLVPG